MNQTNYGGSSTTTEQTSFVHHARHYSSENFQYLQSQHALSSRALKDSDTSNMRD